MPLRTRVDVPRGNPKWSRRCALPRRNEGGRGGFILKLDNLHFQRASKDDLGFVADTDCGETANVVNNTRWGRSLMPACRRRPQYAADELQGDGYKANNRVTLFLD
jgi:hypothetical protein